MDERLRGLERRWRNSGDADVGRAYLHARGRTESWFHMRVMLSGHFSHLGPSESQREEYLHEETGIVMVAIPAGAFEMGTKSQTSESPVHTVEFKRPFLMSKTAVTQGQWKTLMDTNPAAFQGTSNSPTRGSLVLDPWGDPFDEHPVESLTFEMARMFCDRSGLRLPTEAMYEYTARATCKEPFPNGSSIQSLEPFAWSGLNEDEPHRAVGKKQRNYWGLFDVIGNTMSWCRDTWHATYDGAPENGFVAWGDATYNHSLWVEGNLEDLILAGVGCKPYDDGVDLDDGDLEYEPRRVAYGLSVLLAPPPGARASGVQPRPLDEYAVPDAPPVGVRAGPLRGDVRERSGATSPLLTAHPSVPASLSSSGLLPNPRNPSRSSTRLPSGTSGSASQPSGLSRTKDASPGVACPSAAAPTDSPPEPSPTLSGRDHTGAFEWSGLEDPSPAIPLGGFSDLEVGPLGGVAINARDPDAEDDLDAGHEVGDRWMSQASDKMFVCVENNPGEAFWAEVQATPPERVIRGMFAGSFAAPAAAYLSDAALDYIHNRDSSRVYKHTLESIGLRVIWG